MAARSPTRVAVSRHVYLRTQQRRLRHVKSIVIRNLTLSENDFYLDSPLALSTYFTLHPSQSPEKVLYESELVSESYNPSWEAIHFTSPDYCKYAALPGFILKVWVSHFHGGRTSSKNSHVALQRTIDLLDLAYLGSMVSKDGAGYPPNSVVVGMFEGYYTHSTVSGVITPPKVVHSMTDLLPPMSLLEVNKSEVQDSYHHPTLKRILNRQEVLNSATETSKQRRDSVKRYKKREETFFQHSQDRERLAMRVKLLHQQLDEEQMTEETERKTLYELKEGLNSKEEALQLRLKELGEQKAQYESDYQHHCKRMDRLSRFERFCILRECSMVHELGQTFFITETTDMFAICHVILPNADQHDQPNIQDQLGVALGYVAQLVHHIASTLSTPLQYPIRLNGSKSSIYDYISDMSVIQNTREFPLFLRGSEKDLFMYAVYLLNKDICQLRQYSGLGVSKSLFKRTLPNLKSMMDKLISPLLSHTKPEGVPSLQPVSVPIVPTPVSSSHATAREMSNSTMSPTPPSQTLDHETYPNLPSPPMSLYQENELLQHPRDSSPEPEPHTELPSQMHSPPLQFELHDAFLRPNHTSSSCYNIQSKPAPMFPLLSPIYSEGSPAPSEDREWEAQSHSHADLHKAGSQQFEHELSPAGMGLHVSEDEEGTVAGGGSGGVIMLEAMENGKPSLNGVEAKPHQHDEQQCKEESPSPATMPLLTLSSRDETEMVETTQFGVERLSEAEHPPARHSLERIHEVSNEQEFPLIEEQRIDSTVNPFKEEIVPPPGPTAGTSVNYQYSGFMKTGLATPHMLKAEWEMEEKETQVNVTYQPTSTQKHSQSPGRDSQFLEDFIDNY